jgi:hypothetical protein
MGAPVSIRTDIPADELRRLARQESNGRVTCRLMALANALDGMRRAQAAHQAEMDRQTLRDWVIRFNAEGVEDLRDRPKSGRPSWLDDGQLATFKALVLRGPERDGMRATPRSSSLERACCSPPPLVRLGGRATRIATCRARCRLRRLSSLRAQNLPERSAPALVRLRPLAARGRHYGAAVLRAPGDLGFDRGRGRRHSAGAQTAGVPCCRTHFGAGGAMSAASRACSRA